MNAFVVQYMNNNSLCDQKRIFFLQKTKKLSHQIFN